MVADSDLDVLIRKPKNARAFVKKHWGDGAPANRSFGIKGISSEVDYVLCRGNRAEASCLGFLQADETIVGKVKRVRRTKIHGETVKWNEYDTEKDFEYGPPSALRSPRVAEINLAFAPVDDEWVRLAYKIDDLTSESERERLTAADYDQRIQLCQVCVRGLKAFITRTANAQMGLFRFTW